MTTGNSCALTPPKTVPAAAALVAREPLCSGLAPAVTGDASSAPAATAHAQPLRRWLAGAPDSRTGTPPVRVQRSFEPCQASLFRITQHCQAGTASLPIALHG